MAVMYVAFLTKEQQESKECCAAKEQELKKMQNFKIYDMYHEEVPYCGQSCISTRRVLTLKNGKPRARLVTRGFEEKENIQFDSPTVGKSAMHLFLTIAASRQWKIKTTDMKSAFLQGDEMERDVYIKPPKEACEKDGYVWKLKRCLHGLSDASRQFYMSVSAQMKQLGCQQCSVEPTLFYRRDENGQLIGIFVSHIKNPLH